VPATREALRLTDAYRAQLLGVRQRTVGLARQQWAQVNREDLDGSFAAWLGATAAVVELAQATGAGAADAYLAAYLTAELGRRVPAQGLDLAAYAGRAGDGRALPDALRPALLTVKVALVERRPPDVALRMGLNRAVRTIAREVLGAPRRALADAMGAHERVAGWRRATSGNPCGACMGAATGALHASDEALDVHDHCRCVTEPVVRGVRERHRRPTGRQLFDALTTAQQDELFAGRGGAEKAELIRSGAVPLEALITRCAMATTADQITETPLSQLTPS
jgi:hypothetical protein